MKDQGTPTEPGMLMTSAELARELGLTEWAIRAMVKRSQIPPVCIRKIGHRIRFDRKAIKDWLDSLIPTA